MPDKDEFEPVRGEWNTVYKLFVDGKAQASSQQIAQRALEVVANTLHKCGGCLPLPQLVLLLTDISKPQTTAISDHLFPTEALQKANEKLDRIERSIADQRICAVAVRTTRSYAHKLILGVRPNQLSNTNKIGPDLAQHIIKDVIAHCCLDRARAFATTSRFENGATSLSFYREVMQAIKNSDNGLSQQFYHEPSCTTLSYQSLISITA